MVRRVSRRLVTTIMLLTVAGVFFAMRGPASAAPAYTAITITGTDVSQPLTVRATDNPALFAALLDQVSWLRGKGQTNALKAGDLGPKYTLVVLAGDVAKQTFDLYPLAKGGPRACRPGKQPGQSSTGSSAWFYGRLTMNETLRTAGVPLPEQPDSIHGGVGGGERVIPETGLSSGEDIDRTLGELRRLLLLNGAVLLTITLGLAGISLLVRRRTR